MYKDYYHKYCLIVFYLHLNNRNLLIHFSLLKTGVFLYSNIGKHRFLRAKNELINCGYLNVSRKQSNNIYGSNLYTLFHNPRQVDDRPVDHRPVDDRPVDSQPTTINSSTINNITNNSTTINIV